MIKVLFILVIFLSFLLESRISIFGAQPNLTAAVVYYFGLKNGATKGLLFGAMIGIIGDGISGGILGPGMLGKGFVGFFSSFMSGGSFFRWTPLLGMIGIFFLTAFDGIIVFFSRAIFEHMPTSITSAISIALISAELNSFFGVFLKPKNE